MSVKKKDKQTQSSELSLVSSSASSDDSLSMGDKGWISWFCQTRGHEFFCGSRKELD